MNFDTKYLGSCYKDDTELLQFETELITSSFRVDMTSTNLVSPLFQLSSNLISTLTECTRKIVAEMIQS